MLLEKYDDGKKDGSITVDVERLVPSIGHFVRELRLKKRVGITKEQFHLIGYHCPNLEIFGFNNWRHYVPSALLPFKRIKEIPRLFYPRKSRFAILETRNTLTHIDMQQRMARSLLRQNSLLPFLFLAGNTLTHLTIEGSYNYTDDVCELDFNPHRLELLHRFCKHLKYIKFTMINFSATSTDVQAMISVIRGETTDEDKFAPVTHMKSLYLSSLHLKDPIWLPYLALKYPHLVTMHIYFSLNAFESYINGHSYVLEPGKCLDAFSHMACELGPSLKSLTLTDVQASHFDGEDFFYHLSETGIQLDSLQLRYQSDFFNTPQKLRARHALTADILWAVVDGQANSIQSLDVDIWVNASRHFEDFIQPISMCTHLKELRLASDEYGRYNFTPYPIDVILDACQGLTTLRLARTAIVVNDKHSAKCRHPLRKFDVAISCISQDLFDYISKRCPRLNELVLDTDTWMPKELEMNINMPNHTFDYVYINELNHLHTPLLEGNLGRGTRVNLCAITQIDRIQKKLNRYRERIESRNTVDVDSVPYIPENIEEFTDYYHLYEATERRYRYPPANIRKLRKNEVNTLKNLLQFYQNNPIQIEGPRVNDEERLDRYVKRKEWLDDVQFGLLHLTCKSIKKFRHHWNVLYWPEVEE
ncbi:hypothetical protein BDF20DRAFT_850680 [Mycotypha africana]|uniref:uncharacterized protein n=1 Tax=Mycotypha africana TaxID=64632 RepID=UPI002301F259|nr:uncharacterized protein BDF20DRAFT_850680 [Mycotypha africana]KAI8987515.1 hypothetical protein BDF20DRAFT_850680 [Mycotypha africana]